MIPKIIHYCWFGGNPLPEDAQKCIASWKKFMPDYEIKEWNESNFDVNITPYTKEAYEARKYAFVSDYARFWVLYHYGGLYFDTDVEVIKPFDDIVAKGPFMGNEIDGSETSAIMVAPGLGLGATANMKLYDEILQYYNSVHFMEAPGNMNMSYAVVKITTDHLLKYGLKNSAEIQQVEGFTIYPKCYFNPFEDATGKLNILPETHSIHWYSKTWLNVSPLRQKISRLAHRIFGVHFIHNLRKKFK